MFIDRKVGDIIRNMLILYTNIKVGNFNFFIFMTDYFLRVRKGQRNGSAGTRMPDLW